MLIHWKFPKYVACRTKRLRGSHMTRGPSVWAPVPGDTQGQYRRRTNTETTRQQLLNSVSYSHPDALHSGRKRKFVKTIFLVPTHANEINHILKTKHNCQSYDIPSKFLKLANTAVSKWLAELFNRSINGGVFPDSLKIACITSIS